MDILQRKPLYFYILNMMDKQINSQKFIMVPYASSAIACIIHGEGDEPHMSTDQCFIPVQRHKSNYDSTINAFLYECPKSLDE